MIKHARVTIGTTATNIDIFPTLNGHGWLILQNTGAASIYLGDSTVTTSSYGYELKASTELRINDITIAEQLYGVVASGTVVINALIQGA